MIVPGGGAGGEFAVALALVAAQRADALHVSQYQRFGARQGRLVDAERLEQLRQLIRCMRPLTHQLIQVGGGYPQIAGDLVEAGRVSAGATHSVPADGSTSRQRHR